MATENTSLKNTTPAGDSNTANEMVIGKINTYQRTFFVVAGSLLALLVLIAVAGTSGGQHLQPSTPDIAEGAVALADYEVDSANLALTNDIFGLDAISKNNEAPCPNCPGIIECAVCFWCTDYRCACPQCECPAPGTTDCDDPSF